MRICYFGIYAPTAPRDKVYLEGFKKLGITTVECVDNSAGFLKFFRLAKKHKVLKNQYDTIWVGYLSTMVAPLARVLSRKKVIFNALDSWYDRAILDRGLHSRFLPIAWLIWFFDFLAFHLSHAVLVESEQQKLFIARKFFVNPQKLFVIFTGADETVFHPDPAVLKASDFTVVFRGLFLPATGVEVVFEAAKILKNENIRFLIIGWGETQFRLREMIEDYKLSNVNLSTVFLEPNELRKTILSAHCMLGQFSNHERLTRTIQHKTFEALALGMPYITRDSASNRELLTDGVNCLFVPPADPRVLAESILRLKNDSVLRQKLGEDALALYRRVCDKDVLTAQVFNLLQKL